MFRENGAIVLLMLTWIQRTGWNNLVIKGTFYSEFKNWITWHSCREIRHKSRGMSQWHHFIAPLQWRHNGRDGVSNHQPHDCLLNRLFRRRSKKISKLRLTGLCAGYSPVTGEFSAKKASNSENVSIDDVIMSRECTNVIVWRDIFIILLIALFWSGDKALKPFLSSQ